MHAFEFLAATSVPPPAGICVLYGDEPFLKQQVLQRLKRAWTGEDVPVATYEGSEAEWRDVMDEVATVSLFGGSRVCVLVDADDFVRQHRGPLEEFVEHLRKGGILILAVASWPGNTRLYKSVAAHGLQIDCGIPSDTRGKTKVVDEKKLTRWLIEWGKQHHEVILQTLAAQVLLDLVGPHLGLLDQSLAKLALYAESDRKITAELVREAVGGWKAQTTWDLVDAVVSGRGAEALLQFDRLLQAGEEPAAMFGQLAWSLRRYAQATRIFEQAQRQKRKIDLKQSLLQAGIRDWPAGSLAAAEKHLLQLGRERAGQLYRWLMELDLALKGSHGAPQRARFAFELFFIRMDQHRSPRRATAT